MVVYAQIRKLPYKYKDVIKELKESGLDINEVLEGCYDAYTIFESSKVLRKMAVERIISELDYYAIEKPQDYIDGYGRFGYTVDVVDFVDSFLDDLRKYYERLEN